MTIELRATMPRWAPLADPIQIGFTLANRGDEAIYVNHRCAAGPPGSGADISVQVFDRHGRRVPSATVEVPPPPASAFVRVEPGRFVYGAMVHDLLWDHELALGRYEVELIYRVVDQAPPELAGKPVFTEMIRAFNHFVEVIPWGAPPPEPRTEALR